MKKLIPILISLVLLSLAIQFLVVFFTEHHEVKYSIKTNDNAYMIEEEYFLKETDEYKFKVIDKKNTYVFSYTGNLNKQENVIKDIKYYEDSDVECILPVYKNDEIGYISCFYDGIQASRSYLEQKNIKGIDKFLGEIGKKHTLFKSSNKSEKIDNFYVFRENILDNVIFTMWSYKGFYLINDKDIEKKFFLTKDQYENSFSRLIGKYYVSADVDSISSFEFTKFYIYDITDGSRVAVDLDVPVAQDFVINGIYGDKLYFTDYRTNQQFVLDPDKAKVSLTGDLSSGFKYFDGDELVTIKDLKQFASNKHFEINYHNDELSKKYDILEIKESGDMLFFRTRDGKFYKVYKNLLDNPVLLFEFLNISEWGVSKDSLYIVVNDYLYYYNDKAGLLPIINNNEFIYNYKNVCNFMKK